MTTLIDDGLRSLMHQMSKGQSYVSIYVDYGGKVTICGPDGWVTCHLSDRRSSLPSEVIASWSKK